MLRRSVLRWAPVGTAAAATSTLSPDFAKSVAVSPRCLARVDEVNLMQGWKPPKPLRLKIVAGGCQGFSYEFGFDSTIHPEKDIVLAAGPPPAAAPASESGDIQSDSPKSQNAGRTTDEVDQHQHTGTGTSVDEAVPKVVVDKKSIKKLQGATIDYYTELKGSAFVVIGNELVDVSCACGQSFSMMKAQRERRQARLAAEKKEQAVNAHTQEGVPAAAKAPLGQKLSLDLGRLG